MNRTPFYSAVFAAAIALTSPSQALENDETFHFMKPPESDSGTPRDTPRVRKGGEVVTGEGGRFLEAPKPPVEVDTVAKEKMGPAPELHPVVPTEPVIKPIAAGECFTSDRMTAHFEETSQKPIMVARGVNQVRLPGRTLSIPFNMAVVVGDNDWTILQTTPGDKMCVVNMGSGVPQYVSEHDTHYQKASEDVGERESKLSKLKKEYNQHVFLTMVDQDGDNVDLTLQRVQGSTQRNVSTSWSVLESSQNGETSGIKLAGKGYFLVEPEFQHALGLYSVPGAELDS